MLARHFTSIALEADNGEDDTSLGDLIVKMHGSHIYTDGLRHRPEIVPAQLVHLASAGIQGLRAPANADTTYDVRDLPFESEEGEVDDEDGHAGTGRQKKRRDGSPLPGHLRVWMPACMVRYVLPDLVDGYEAALEAKRRRRRRKYREYSKGICCEEEGKAYVSLYDKSH